MRMSNFDTLCRALESMDPETYSDTMIDKTLDILAGFDELSEDRGDCIALYCDFLLCSVAADGKLTEEEFLLAKPVLDRMLEIDTDYEEALRYFAETGLDQPEGYKDTMDGIVDMLGEVSSKLKEDLILLCMMVCAVDGTISAKEKAWIRQLIE